MFPDEGPWPIVCLSEAERKTCQEAIQKRKANSRKVRRVRILLQVDVDGLG